MTPIVDRSTESAKLLWLFAIAWNALCLPVAFLIPREAEQNRLMWFATIFPAVGVGLLIAALRLTLKKIKFRESVFHPEAPAELGGVLRGRVEVPVSHRVFQRATSISARLTCFNRTSDGDSTSERIHWRDEVEVPRHLLLMRPEAVAIPIVFPIPLNMPATSSGSAAMVWRVDVEAELPGIDYNATFDVPVSPATNAVAPNVEERAVFPLPLTTISESHTDRGLVLTFPPFRARGVAIFTLIFTLVWVAAIIFMLRVDAPLFFPIVFGLFALLLLYLVLDLFFGKSTVTVRPDELLIRSELVLAHETRLAKSDVSDVRLQINMQSGGGSGTPYYDVEVVKPDGRKVTAGKYIRSRREAEAVKAKIRARMGLSPS